MSATEWEYGRQYVEFDGRPARPRIVSKAEHDAHEPDGYRADGSPYWNYTRVRRRKAGAWESADIEPIGAIVPGFPGEGRIRVGPEPLTLPCARLASHPLELDEATVVECGHDDDALDKVFEKLRAEDARLHRLMPEAPPGFRWEGETQMIEHVDPVRFEARIVYRLVEVQP